MTDKELLKKLKSFTIIELYGGLREKAQNLKNRGFLRRSIINSPCWIVTRKGKSFIQSR